MRVNVREPRTLQYLDLPTLVPEMLTTFRAMLTVARTAGANVPADLLPTNEAMQPFLTPSLMETWTDQAGWHARSIGPFPAFGI